MAEEKRRKDDKAGAKNVSFFDIGHWWSNLSIQDPVADEVNNEIARPVALRLFKNYPWLLDENYAIAVEGFTRLPALLRMKTGGHPFWGFLGGLLQRTAQEYREIYREHKGKPLGDVVQDNVAGMPVTPPPAFADMTAELELMGRILDAAQAIEHHMRRQAFVNWHKRLDPASREKFYGAIKKLTQEQLRDIFNRFSAETIDGFIRAVEDEAAPVTTWTDPAQARLAVENGDDVALKGQLGELMNHLAGLTPGDPKKFVDNRRKFWQAVVIKTPNINRFKEVMGYMSLNPAEPDEVLFYYGLRTDGLSGDIMEQIWEFAKKFKERMSGPVDESDPLLIASRNFRRGTTNMLGTSLTELANKISGW